MYQMKKRRKLFYLVTTKRMSKKKSNNFENHIAPPTPVKRYIVYAHKPV